jgi:HK97 family phage major capsid protein
VPNTLDINKLRDQLGLTQITEALKQVNDDREKSAADKAAATKAIAEEARVQKLIEAATGDQRAALVAANDTVKALESKLDAGNSAFAEALQNMQKEVIGYQDQIKQVLAARDNQHSFVAGAVSKAMFGNDQELFEKEVENVALVSFITEKGMFETKYGEAHLKAVNNSSSIEVSSENYETIFSQRILRDMQKLMVVGNMFEELPMTSKLLTMMIEPDSQIATWVDSTTYGTDATTGNEIKAALTETTFRTYKLASKAYMTDETEEDAIVALLPIIRRHLVESHVKAIETAFMTGDGSGKPLGLLGAASVDSKKIATLATSTGTVKVTAKMIQVLRRNMGQYGLDLSKLALVVSMDAYFDLLEDEEWQDVSQVGAENSLKLQGQVGRIYGLAVLVSNYFPAKALGSEFCALVYRENFVVPRQRTITVERERQAGKQRDAYYVTQRLNLQRLIDGKGIVTGTYAVA